MPQQDINFFLIASSIAILLITIGLIVFIRYFFQAQKNAQLKEQENKMYYEQSIASAKTEVQANTLGYISKELHDNVGQLLYVAKMYAAQLKKNADAQTINELDNILLQTAGEVRHISHSLRAQSAANFSLSIALQTEIARIEKLKLIRFSTDLDQYTNALSSDEEVILFRIMQEFIANALKHAMATNIKVRLASTASAVSISMADNGIGYAQDAPSSNGTGLHNMKERAAMLNAKLTTNSAPNKGTTLDIQIPITTPKT